MIELALKIPSSDVLEQLTPILKKLKITYRLKTFEPVNKDPAKKAAIFAKIRSGALSRPNFEQFISEFEESR